MGLDKVTAQVEGEKLILKKTVPQLQLDFSASAKGYAIDLIGQLLEGYAINNFFIEIGGENKAKGSKFGSPWTVGVNTPKSTAALNKFSAIVLLNNTALATSVIIEIFIQQAIILMGIH